MFTKSNQLLAINTGHGMPCAAQIPLWRGHWHPVCPWLQPCPGPSTAPRQDQASDTWMLLGCQCLLFQQTQPRGGNLNWQSTLGFCMAVSVLKNPKQVSSLHIPAKSPGSRPWQAQKGCCCVGLGTRPCSESTGTGLCQGTGAVTWTEADAEVSWALQRSANKVKQHRGVFVYFLKRFIIQGLVPPAQRSTLTVTATSESRAQEELGESQGAVPGAGEQ